MAAASGIVKDIKEELKCSLCLDHFKEPKLLHCLHTFCKQCLVPTVERGVIVCPLCRHATPVSPANGVEGLASNFLYNRMLNIVRIQPEASEDDVNPKCGNCDSVDSPSVYCFECGCFLCQECLVDHNRIRSIRERHQVTDTSGLSASELQRMLCRPSRCELHRRSVLELYCNQCETSVCKLCVSTSTHQGHRCEPLAEVSAKRREEMETAVAEMERRLDTLRIKKRAFEEKAAEMKEEARDAEGKVHRTAERFVGLIRHHELAMIEQLNQHKDFLDNMIADERSLLNSHLEELDRRLRFSREVLRHGSEADVVDLKPSTAIVLREGDERIPKMAWRYMHVDYSVNKDVFNFCEPGKVLTRSTDPEKTQIHKEELPQPILAGGKARFAITTHNVNGEVCYSELDAVSVKVFSKVLEITEKNLEILDQGDGSYSVTFAPEYPGVLDIHVRVNGEDVPQSPFSVLMSFHVTSAFGSQGNGPGHFRGPTGIAVSQDGDVIAVSDSGNKRIQLFDKTGKFLDGIGGYFRAGKSVQFGLPAGISYDKFGNLVVVDQLKDKVVLIDPATKNIVKEFGGSGPGRGRFEHPWSVFVDTEGRIVVSDTDNDRVQVFDKNGEFLFTFGDRGHGSDLNGPDSTVFCNGRFYVSDGESHAVKVFDKVGNFLFKFGEKGQEDGQLENPTGLCVYKQNALLVCDYRNDRVQIFTMDGKHVHSFGSYGKAMGQFWWPEGVATLRDGSVLVTDSENNRVQVLK